MEKTRPDPVTDSFIARLAREREKAIQKYGNAGQALGGHPDYDIIDYAINEVVGMHRYAEMIQARADQNDMEWGFAASSTLRNLASEMRNFATEVGEDLINARIILLQSGHKLGKEEVR